jgi:hypothetical protein
VKTAAYNATLSIELARSKTMKLAGPLSEVARIGSNTSDVNQTEGRTSAKAILEPAGIKRIQPTDTSVSARLVNWHRIQVFIDIALQTANIIYLRAKRSKPAIWRGILFLLPLNWD